VPIVLKSGSLNLLEPYGPVQACNGIALPLAFSKQMVIPLSVLTPDIYSKKTEYFTDNLPKLSIKLSLQPVNWNVTSMNINLLAPEFYF